MATGSGGVGDRAVVYRHGGGHYDYARLGWDLSHVSKRDTNYRLPISSCPLPVSPGLCPYSRTSRLAHLEDQLVRTHQYIHQP